MVVVEELRNIPIFSCLSDAERQRFADRAADVRLEEGEWLIREGEMAYFFVLLEGQLQLLKDVLGSPRELHQYKAGDFFGEVPILSGCPRICLNSSQIQGSRRSLRSATPLRSDSNLGRMQRIDSTDND